MVEFYESREEKGKILAVKIPPTVKEIIKQGKVLHGSIYLEQLKHSVTTLDTMNQVKAFIESGQIKDYRAVSLGLSPAEGCRIANLVETMHLILASPESSHVKIIIPTTLNNFKTKDAIAKAFEAHFKKRKIERKLTEEELKRIYVFQAFKANEHVQELKKFLEIKEN